MTQLGDLDLGAHLHPDPLQWLRSRQDEDRRLIIVVDDDPTGTQTTAGASIVTSTDADDIEWLVQQQTDLNFVLTNSRAMNVTNARDVNRQIGRLAADAAARHRRPLDLVSRCDSTLRGHFPTEPVALAEGANRPNAVIVFVPFFFEAGRITVDGVHYVVDAGRLIPVADTAFARDAAFGYNTSELTRWVSEKFHNAVQPDDVVRCTLRTIRVGGPSGVADVLQGCPDGSVVVVDSADYRDARVVIAGLRRAQASSDRYVLRTAASALPGLAGLEPAAPVLPPRAANNHGGLVVVGSHVPLTTRQLDKLTATRRTTHLEIDAAELVQGASTAASTVAERAVKLIAQGRSVTVSTSRTRLDGRDPVATASLVADGVCRSVDSIVDRIRPSYVVTKGGITSHRLATEVLGIRRGRVHGPIVPGVPVWVSDVGARWPGLTTVVFPGNVGGDDTLAEVVQLLEERR
ncbi:uncharacterized protein YgbK (DUF1537 family) [Ilumatobacter fluminis]|uniref:Uncharacterized protein YgbK (DUF1537 family) n=1 Tax=Ilumatobacter fluminis TaxID=467091 RepID=A0A4R7HVM7_9ACTN|nr:four-carbon acid sugar kinase family protein [Ilumatobacter fluminis]TDT14895.1 uncharacterized protein YgbK (DUF1537 family) [Ilumatobacter fluminis]